ncbi:hypothetical protein EZV62_026876 [Acer yangbiense]|uniref:Reverse transcriptase Ty1/copia-type domain-containing protein n=1 Tax=Acer yangbiense TaxID=1000413 RepID=A0A5C7GTD2_9ROSI|nr:hypothetical protein EZV62_026876 [Acer yangbiense]
MLIASCRVLRLSRNYVAHNKQPPHDADQFHWVCSFLDDYRKANLLVPPVSSLLKPVAGVYLEEINDLKKQLSGEFKMKDFGAANQILGMRISRYKQRGTLQLSQAKYVRKVLQRFSMGDVK